MESLCINLEKTEDPKKVYFYVLFLGKYFMSTTKGVPLSSLDLSRMLYFHKAIA